MEGGLPSCCCSKLCFDDDEGEEGDPSPLTLMFNADEKLHFLDGVFGWPRIPGVEVEFEADGGENTFAGDGRRGTMD